MASENSPRRAKPAHDIAQLLLQYGADENLRRRGLIMVRRGAWAQPVFYRGTSTYNQHNLFDLLAYAYADREMNKQLAFPDFKKLRIYCLPDARTGEVPAVPKHPLAGLQFAGGDCSANIHLPWGSLVEIPEADHKINEKWEELPVEVWDILKRCVTRKIQLKVGDETREFALAPPVSTLQSGTRRFAVVGSLRARPPGTVNGYRLEWVVQNSKMLRTSSDLSRVKVTRRDPVTGQDREMIFDISDLSPNEPRTDLWLLDGDLIEVP